MPAPQGNALFSVAFGNDRYVAVGDGGAIVISTNGVNWTIAASTNSANLSFVRFGAGRFVAVGAGGTILQSVDGDRWTVEQSGTQEPLTALAVKDGIFVAVSSAGSILRSTDGITWAVKYKAPQAIWSITAGSRFFLASNGPKTSKPGVLSTQQTASLPTRFN